MTSFASDTLSQTLANAAAQASVSGCKTTRRDFLTTATALGVTASTAYGLMGLTAPQTAAAAPRQGGTARLLTGIRTMKDPLSFDYTPLANFTRGWLEYLVAYNNDGTFSPVLLSGWDVNEDASVYLLHVRPGVTWNTGEPFTAQDVAFNIARMCDSAIEGNSLAARFTALTDAATGRARPGAIDIVDPMTVRLTLAAPDIAVIANLADYPAAIVHQSFDADTMLDTPIGTGPYVPVAYHVGDRAVLERNPNHTWWNAGNGAWLDRIEFIDYGEDRATWLTAAEAGEVDHVFTLDGDYVEAFRAIDDWSVAEISTAATIVVRPNQNATVNGVKPYADPRVRRALALAIDNQITLELGAAGQGSKAENHHVSPVQAEYTALPPISRNVAKAQALLRDAGMSAFEHELISLDAGWMKDTADACAAQLRDAGIKVKRTVLPASSFWNEWTRHSYSTTAWNHRPFAVQVFSVAYSSESAWNETGVANPELDAVIAKALTIADPEARRKVMAQAERIMQDEGITLQPYWRALFNAQNRNLKGGEVHLSQVVDPCTLYWEA